MEIEINNWDRKMHATFALIAVIQINKLTIYSASSFIDLH